MIYSNKRYVVSISPDKTFYEVTNRDNGIVEYSSPVQLEAVRAAYFMNEGLEVFFNDTKKPVEEEDILSYIPTEYLN